MQYIEIEKDMIPYSFDIQLGSEIFVMEVKYNERLELFTISLYDAENNPLVYGEPLIIKKELFIDVRDLTFPIVRIVPLDPSDIETEITYANMGVAVILTVNYEEGEV